ncbi:MAG TPA: hypothetical protein VGQ84_07925 [Gaiellaceae bacterium]|jgi:hypothetical protein|nr:hypothetical protein [Gaiellaceae bacterium]
MATRELDRPQAESDDLEALWELPSAQAGAARWRWALPAEPRLLARSIFWGWIAVLATGILLAPAPDPHAVYPWYSAIALYAWLGAGVAAWALFSAGMRPLAYVVGSLAGAHGIVVGIACRQTGHHTGSWWLFETVAFALLTAASLVGVATSRRAAERD